MICTITLNTVREIKEKIGNSSVTPGGVEFERWATEGGFTENEAEPGLHKPSLPEQKFRDQIWSQAGSVSKDIQSTSLKQYRPSLTDISRHNPHV
jgi:hypothetical protein